jgi:hypothetical protein
MTRTLSTPVAGDAVRAATCEGLKPGVGAEFAVAPVQAVSPSEIASTEAAAPRRQRAAYRRASLTCTTCTSWFSASFLLPNEPLSVNDAQPVATL